MIEDDAVERMAALLRRRRAERGVSRRVLADAAGVNVSVVSRAERGIDARLSTWERLFKGLGDRLLFDSIELCEEAGDLLSEEMERRILRRLDGLMAR